VWPLKHYKPFHRHDGDINVGQKVPAKAKILHHQVVFSILDQFSDSEDQVGIEVKQQ